MRKAVKSQLAKTLTSNMEASEGNDSAFNVVDGIGPLFTGSNDQRKLLTKTLLEYMLIMYNSIMDTAV